MENIHENIIYVGVDKSKPGSSDMCCVTTAMRINGKIKILTSGCGSDIRTVLLAIQEKIGLTNAEIKTITNNPSTDLIYYKLNNKPFSIIRLIKGNDYNEKIT